MIWLQLLGVAALFIAYRWISSFIKERRLDAFAKSHGCQLPLQKRSGLIIGLIRLRRIFRMNETGEDLFDILGEDFNQSPTFGGKAFDGTKSLVTFEPANLQAMLATQFEDFGLGELRSGVFGPVFGKSIFTTDGAFWQHSRAMFRPQFSRDNINDLESTDRAAAMLIEAVGERDGSGWSKEVDLLELFYNFTLDTATEFLFGHSVQSQRLAIELKKQEASGESKTATNDGTALSKQATSGQFSEDFQVLGSTLMTRIRLQSLYWLGDSFRFRRASRNVRQFADHFVQEAIASAKTNKSTSGEKHGKEDYNLLQALASETDDSIELRDQILALLFAGRDTTASLLGWVLVMMALHPDLTADLRQQVLRQFPPGGSLDFAGLKSCRSLQHFINETMRLFPLVPLNGRQALRDTTLPTGGGPDGKSPIVCGKGQDVGYSVYFLHRRKDLWGDDANEFRPSRWEQARPSAWAYLPFNGGPRICIGQQFALTEASFLLVRLLQKYDAFEPVDRVQMSKLRKGLGLTMWPADGVKVRLHEAAK